MKNLENRKSLIVLILVVTLAIIVVAINFKAASDGKPWAIETREPHTGFVVTTTTSTTSESVCSTSETTAISTTSTVTSSLTTTAIVTTTVVETTTPITTEEIKEELEQPIVELGTEAPVEVQLLESEPIESETAPEVIPVVEEERDNSFYFYKDSMRVHTSKCKYFNPNSMEKIEGNYIEEARPCQECHPDIEIGNLYVPEEPTPEVPSGNMTREYIINEMTYYKGSTWTCSGARGTTLTNNYSCASNAYPFGTILYIKSSDGSVDGYYEVEDRGGMSNNVVDIYYNDYSLTPYSFRQLGRVSVEVWVVS